MGTKHHFTTTNFDDLLFSILIIQYSPSDILKIIFVVCQICTPQKKQLISEKGI